MIVVFFLLLSCQTTPSLDLSETHLYLFPKRLYLKDTNQDFKFNKKHILKAKQASKKLKYDILYEVYLNKDGSVSSVKSIKKTRYADNETVAKIRHQISKRNFFYTSGKYSAFFYGVKIRTEVEYR